ncbi:FixH family protein [Maribacter sp. X9]|uniref:FixH family protein n=1 Tax=Maribacter sp. X9 TaxID=3402159 RepID=UPI003AF3B1A8
MKLIFKHLKILTYVSLPLFFAQPNFSQKNTTNEEIVILSKNEEYKIILDSSKIDKKINQFVEWQFKLERMDKEKPVVGASIKIDGGMPSHGHGLPSTPKVVNLGKGIYKITGLKFNMPGSWTINFLIFIDGRLQSLEYSFEL